MYGDKTMIHLTTVKTGKNKWVITPSDCIDKYKAESPLHDKALDNFVDGVGKGLDAIYQDLAYKAMVDTDYDRIGREFGLLGGMLGRAL